MSRSRFGRPRFGGSTATLLSLSALAGIVGGTLLAWIIATLASLPLTWMAIFAASAIPITASLAWVLMVDRDTLTGAPRNPEESVENVWLHKASSAALLDISGIIGLTVLALTILGDRVSLSADTALMAVWFAGLIDVFIRYQVLKRRAL